MKLTILLSLISLFCYSQKLNTFKGEFSENIESTEKGYAEYSYISNSSHSRIFQGKFTYKERKSHITSISSMIPSILQTYMSSKLNLNSDIFNIFSINGYFNNNLKDSLWSFKFSNDKYNDIKLTLSGYFKKGVLIYFTSYITLKNKEYYIYSLPSLILFSNGAYPVKSVIYGREINEFDSKGFLIFKHKNINETIVFKGGIEWVYEKINESTGDIIEFDTFPSNLLRQMQKLDNIYDISTSNYIPYGLGFVDYQTRSQSELFEQVYGVFELKEKIENGCDKINRGLNKSIPFASPLLQIDKESFDEYIENKLERSETLITNEPYAIVEDMPEFIGGEKELLKYFKENIKFPDSAINNEISGTVMTEVVIMEDGSISNIRILKKVGGGCDEEAVRVLKSMPKWKPGRHKGKNVKVIFCIPISFNID
jgi:TonB family protein